MQTLKRAAVAALITLTLGVPAAGQAAPRHIIRLPRDYAAWTRVAECETSRLDPWQVLGQVYPNPFGITGRNWASGGGAPMPDGPVPLARRAAAIRIADRVIAFLRTHGYPGLQIPDQVGPCRSW